MSDMDSEITVEFAVYGALVNGNSQLCRARDVRGLLQEAINRTGGLVPIDNNSMGGDPAPNNTKHFGAQIARNGETYFFGCQEGQTVNFNYGGRPE